MLRAFAVADAAAGTTVGAIADALSALSCGSCLLSVRLSVCPSVCPFVSLSVCPFVRLSVCPLVRLSVCPFVSLSVCPSVGQKVRRFSLSASSMQLRTRFHKFVVWEGLASSTLVPSWVMCKLYSPLWSWTGPPPLQLRFVTKLRMVVGSCGVLRPGHALKKRLFVWGPRGGFPWFFPLRLQGAKVCESCRS